MQSNPNSDSSLAPVFTQFPNSDNQSLDYTALLYELQQSDGTHAQRNPSWFGVAIPNPGNFDIHSDVYIILYFHPQPGQAHYLNNDYYTMSDYYSTGDDISETGGNVPHGADWVQLFAFADRLGGQMAAAVQQPLAPTNNRLVIFPLLAQPNEPSSAPIMDLEADQWSGVIHDIMQDINNNYVSNICTRPKKIVVASLSNGSFYLNKFLGYSSNFGGSILSDIVEVWDFDSDISDPPAPVVPNGIPFRAYWQNSPDGNIPAHTDFVQLPPVSVEWANFPPGPPTEVPPLPPNPSNSSSLPDNDPRNAGEYPAGNLYHHYIRDTMFLDAVWNLDNPPNGRSFPP